MMEGKYFIFSKQIVLIVFVILVQHSNESKISYYKESYKMKRIKYESITDCSIHEYSILTLYK